MKWLEIIKLRSGDERIEILEKMFLFEDEMAQGGLVKIGFYRHAVLESDLSVHLQWESEKPETQGSVLGLRLAHGLKEFGLVDHSVWIEQEK